MTNTEFGQVCANRRAALTAATKLLAAAGKVPMDRESVVQWAEYFTSWLDEPVRKMREARP